MKRIKGKYATKHENIISRKVLQNQKILLNILNHLTKLNQNENLTTNFIELAKQKTKQQQHNNKPIEISQVGYEEGQVYADLTSTL